MDQINNTLLHEKLEDEPMKQFSKVITTVLAELTERKIVDRDTFYFLRPRNARTSRFYILPKIHKKDIAGRPIV